MAWMIWRRAAGVCASASRPTTTGRGTTSTGIPATIFTDDGSRRRSRPKTDPVWDILPSKLVVSHEGLVWHVQVFCSSEDEAEEVAKVLEDYAEARKAKP